LPALLFTALLAFAGIRAAAQDLAFQLDPQHAKIDFILGDVLHTVRGTFQLERGSLRLNSSSGKLDGEIVVNAKSGESGNGMRDRKMHREVLESDRYPDHFSSGPR
jgi:polyisoprenoid-binding protein YceI